MFAVCLDANKFLDTACPRIVNQVLSHSSGGKRKKMLPVLPGLLFSGGQAEIDLINQFRRF